MQRNNYIEEFSGHPGMNFSCKQNQNSNRCEISYWSLIHLDELLEKYNSIWKNLAIILKRNLIENLSTIKKILENNQKSYGMTLQIFMINKCLK